MSEVCGDNRFELIGEFKDKLVEGTNIETSPDEMAVLDNILFRFWQMGWLDKLKAQEHIEARLHLCESCAKEYPECDAAIDGIEFGCGVGNDNIIGCTAYDNRWKAQAPVEPTIGGDADGLCGNWWYQCGKCKEAIDYHDKYCRNCGQAVKWE